MKIAMTTPYYPPADGGIAIFIRELSHELGAMGHDVKVVARFGDEEEIEQIEGGKLRFVIHATRRLKKFKPEVVHAHSTWYALGAGVCYKMFYNRNVRLIFTFHTGQINELARMKRSLFKWLLRKCDYVTFVSDALRKEAENNLKLSTRNIVVYGGVKRRYTDIKKIETFKVKHKILDNELIITYIGPFEWKMKVEGIKLLIRAFKEVIKVHEKSRLLLVGDGTFQKELEALVDNIDLKENVVFAGFLPNVFVPLHVTSIYAHISLQEGLPLALLEAMATGVPIVASHTGGIPEVIIDGENGLLVDSDITSISAAILKLAENEYLRENLATKGKAMVDAKHIWSNTAEQFLNLYKGENKQ